MLKCIHLLCVIINLIIFRNDFVLKLVFTFICFLDINLKGINLGLKLLDFFIQRWVLFVQLIDGLFLLSILALGFLDSNFEFTKFRFKFLVSVKLGVNLIFLALDDKILPKLLDLTCSLFVFRFL